MENGELRIENTDNPSGNFQFSIFNSQFKAWLLASRPKTLTAAATPVMVGAALAFHDGCLQWAPAVICLVFTLLAQVVSNFANDYFDYRKGSDGAARLGPARAVSSGWISPKAMLRAIGCLLAVDLGLGLLLLSYGGWLLVPVGAAVAVFAPAYSPLSYRGWGDVLVFVFFGIVPVGFTYYVQALQWTFPLTVCGAAMGLVIINILVANNYRDRVSDKNVGKRTTIVRFGERFGRWFYLCNGIIAVLLCQWFWLENAVWAAVLPVFYLIFHIKTWREMVRIGEGKGLIGVLEKTARNVLVFGMLVSIGLIV